MTANYVLLEKVTLSANAASVVLDNIPQTGYTDLKIVVSARDTVDNQASIKFNSSTTGYSNIRLQGTGSAAQSTTDSSTSKGIIAYSVNQTSSRPANTFGNAEIYIPNYAGSTNKSFSSDGVEENNGTAAYSKFFAGLLANPAAIESITLSAEGVFEAGSTFSLYGVAAFGTTPEIAPFASGGNIVTNDGTYWYHAFLSSGTFTANKSLTADCLVVAGGGGGGSILGGGGGAGGVLAFSSQSLTASTIYAATVGSGGSGATNYLPGYNGNSSKFGTLTTCDGGGGGSGNNFVGRDGGSGGGGRDSYAGGTATSGQGNNGASGGGVSQTGAGGGGKGSAGSSGSGGKGGDGGAGTNSVTNWGALSSVFSTTGLGVSGYIAGGGGGGKSFGGANSAARGLGGSGGGGDGGFTNSSTPLDNAAVAGVANTGSGGGGAPNNYAGEVTLTAGKNGGSGIVIIRYAMA
jgi:hypothetical protein